MADLVAAPGATNVFAAPYRRTQQRDRGAQASHHTGRTEFGSRGNSLTQIDELGADPGSACYAKGGTCATLTDADAVLGYAIRITHLPDIGCATQAAGASGSLRTGRGRRSWPTSRNGSLVLASHGRCRG